MQVQIGSSSLARTATECAGVICTAEAAYRSGDYASAITLLAPLAANNLTDPTALRITGLCRLRQGAPAEALDFLARAHALAPDDLWTRLHLGIGLQAIGRHGEVANLFRLCQAQMPMDPAP